MSAFPAARNYCRTSAFPQRATPSNRQREKRNFQAAEFPYNRYFMRTLAIVAGLLLAGASACFAQAAPAATAPTPNSTLHQQLEELKTKYGAKTDAPVNSPEIVLKPKPGRQSFSTFGDTRSVYTAVANAFGLRVTFDESLKSRNVRLPLKDVDFETAMNAVALMTNTFWVPVTSKEFLVAPDTAQKRRELSRTLERTFYLSNATTPQDFTDIVNLLRTIFEIRYIVAQPASNSITVRADAATVHQAETLLDQLDLAQPQVMLEIEAIEVNTSTQRNVGVSLPLQFQMFNIPPSILALLASGNAQNLIQQFLNAGGTDLSQLAALAGQSSSQIQSLLANPIVTFGGGLTLFGVSVPPLTANLSLNESKITTLEKASIEASQNNPASFHVGNRYPILTQSFSSGLAATGVNIGVVGAIPGFTYEDLGVLLKAKPRIHGSTAVTLDMELTIKSLGAQVVNSIPVIQNREYKGAIMVKDGEPAVIAGMISKGESKSLVGPPGIGSIPGLNRLVSDEIKSKDTTELIITITPHIQRAKLVTDAPPMVVNPAR
jgi:general secretion pathway protein D